MEQENATIAKEVSRFQTLQEMDFAGNGLCRRWTLWEMDIVGDGYCGRWTLEKIVSDLI